MVKVSAKLVGEADLEGKILEVLDKYKKQFIIGLKIGLTASPAPALLIKACIEILNEMQSNYWGGASSTILAEDPTQFGLPEQKEKVMREILLNLDEAAASITLEGTMRFQLFSDDFYKEGGDPETAIPWMQYFVEDKGLDDGLVWISQEVRAKLLPNRGAAELGRFGVGHMWHLKEMSPAQFNGWLTEAKTGKTYDELKHPQSGKGKQDWFADVLRTSGFSESLMQYATEYARLNTK